MATIRKLKWRKDHPSLPDQAQILFVVSKYLGGAGKQSWREGDPSSCFVTLAGKWSCARRKTPTTLQSKERVIEIWLLHDWDIQIITRNVDDFTYAVADGIEAAIRKNYPGSKR